MNEHDDILKNTIRYLPVYEPAPEVWNHIAAEIGFAAARDALPEYEPAGEGWEKIKAHLSEKQPLQKQRRLLYTFEIAASVCLLLAAWLGIQYHRTEKATVQLSYSQESVYETVLEQPLATDPVSNEAQAFIQVRCQQQVQVCQSPQFQELKAQLDELNTQTEKLEKKINLYGQDADLIKAQIKVENLRAQVTKELIQLLTT